MRVAVAGGTGLVGRLVVDALRRAEHEPLVVARSTGIDLTTGAGLDGALARTDAVIDVSSTQTMSRRGAERFFGSSTQHLLSSGARMGVRHHLVLSIVGSDRVSWGYYAGKQRQEQLVQEGPVPWTILRCTQFHEFAGQLLARNRGPVAAVPRMRIQPVAAAEVAEALVRLVEQPACGCAPELAGPQPEEVVDLARRLLVATGSHRRVLPLVLPGSAGRQMAGGALLPTSDGQRGMTTFVEWLDLLPPRGRS